MQSVLFPLDIKWKSKKIGQEGNRKNRPRVELLQEYLTLAAVFDGQPGLIG